MGEMKLSEYRQELSQDMDMDDVWERLKPVFMAQNKLIKHEITRRAYRRQQKHTRKPFRAWQS